MSPVFSTFLIGLTRSNTFSMSLKLEKPKTKVTNVSVTLGNGSKMIITKPSKPEEVPAPAPVEKKPETVTPPPAPVKEEPKKPEPKPEPKIKAPPVSEPAPSPAEDDYDEEEDFKGEVVEETLKKHLNIVFIGHVDAGKSTLCGHILYLAGLVDQRTVEQYQQESAKMGRGSWYLSWIMDLSKEEREKGKTQEVGVAHFESDVHKYTILDAPGHKTYVPQMIGGAVQADVAVLVVSARAGEFESGFERGGQTSEHLLIAKTSGVRHVIIVINKMDDPSVNWSQTRYNQIIDALNPYIQKEIGFKKDQYTFIPIAALTGYNIKESSSEVPWYNGTTLFAALDQIPAPIRNENDAFRLPVIDKYKTKSIVASGKLEKGIIREGDALVVMPSGSKGSVISMHSEENIIRRAVPGDNIRIILKGVEYTEITTGSVICPASDPCHVATKAILRIRMTQSAPPIISAGFEAVCHIHTDTVPVSIEQIYDLNPSPNERSANQPTKFLRPLQDAYVLAKFDHPVCLELFKDFPQLGRYLIRKEGQTIAIGIVQQFYHRVAAFPIDFKAPGQNKEALAAFRNTVNKFYRFAKVNLFTAAKTGTKGNYEACVKFVEEADPQYRYVVRFSNDHPALIGPDGMIENECVIEVLRRKPNQSTYEEADFEIMKFSKLIEKMATGTQ